jgi:hypothetical protein
MGLVLAMAHAPCDTGPATRVATLVARRVAHAIADGTPVRADLPHEYVVNQLQRLQRLHDRGLLSADELEAMTARLLQP